VIWPDVSYEKMGERLEADPAELRALAKLPWVVTEKIHGAHFALVSDGNQLRCAKRKGYLAADESFFGHERVAAQLRQNVAALCRSLKARAVVVAGELFGGGYPGMASPDDVQPIQTGIWYSPTIELLAYDVARFDDELRYLDFDAAQAACAREEIPFVEPLLVGTYDQAMSFPLGFVTRIPNRALAPLDSNLAEGVVLRPQKEMRVGGRRVLVKRKIAAFAEDERYRGAEKWQPRRSGDELGTLLELAALLVNPLRLQSARSKVGTDRDAILREAADDVMEELSRRLPEEWARCDRALVRGQVEALLLSVG
jgi:Rnl2 family RNA ligase